jgi:hypothetical protein
MIEKSVKKSKEDQKVIVFHKRDRIIQSMVLRKNLDWVILVLMILIHLISICQEWMIFSRDFWSKTRYQHLTNRKMSFLRYTNLSMISYPLTLKNKVFNSDLRILNLLIQQMLRIKLSSQRLKKTPRILFKLKKYVLRLNLSTLLMRGIRKIKIRIWYRRWSSSR